MGGVTEFLCPLKLLMECLHIIPNQEGKDVFQECHKYFIEESETAAIDVGVVGLLIFA